MKKLVIATCLALGFVSGCGVSPTVSQGSVSGSGTLAAKAVNKDRVSALAKSAIAECSKAQSLEDKLSVCSKRSREIRSQIGSLNPTTGIIFLTRNLTEPENKQDVLKWNLWILNHIAETGTWDESGANLTVLLGTMVGMFSDEPDTDPRTEDEPDRLEVMKAIIGSLKFDAEVYVPIGDSRTESRIERYSLTFMLSKDMKRAEKDFQEYLTGLGKLMK